ncbi:hypothetical protein [Hydrogenophaga sp. BPS33]|uniref:hypothetical protein n=1 Tax=Hydrogenophaga sp. BPS33 TaxID=2651974 RepID=UPI001356CDE5|nr:hypothetical protein [Hydrogenophaga sp. BPS33]
MPPRLNCNRKFLRSAGIGQIHPHNAAPPRNRHCSKHAIHSAIPPRQYFQDFITANTPDCIARDPQPQFPPKYYLRGMYAMPPSAYHAPLVNGRSGEHGFHAFDSDAIARVHLLPIELKEFAVAIPFKSTHHFTAGHYAIVGMIDMSLLHFQSCALNFLESVQTEAIRASQEEQTQTLGPGA